MKTTYAVYWVVLAAVLLVPSHVNAQSQPPASLHVEVRAEAHFQTPAGLRWTAAGDSHSLVIPVSVLLRINRGTAGQLTVSASDGHAEGASFLVETAAGPVPVTLMPVAIASYARSGTYETLLVLRLASPMAEEQSATLHLRLATSDGTAKWSQTITIPPAVLQATEVATPSAS